MIICVVLLAPQAESYSSGSVSTRPSLPAVGRLIFHVSCDHCSGFEVCVLTSPRIVRVNAVRTKSVLHYKLHFHVDSFTLHIVVFLSNYLSYAVYIWK